MITISSSIRFGLIFNCAWKSLLRRQTAEQPGGLMSDHAGDEVQRQREDDGRVLLRGDGVEGLQVAQLQRGRGLGDDLTRLHSHSVKCVTQNTNSFLYFPTSYLSQRSAGLFFSLRRDYLRSRKDLKNYLDRIKK